MNRELKIVFMGTPEFAVETLRAIINADMNVVAVVTAPDKPAGRGRKTTASAVKTYAEEQHIPVLQPINLKDENFVNELKTYDANVFVVVAFRMLPKVIWSMPKYGTFNLHASLLPQYRGAAPINWAIINGEAKTGVTTFFIDEKIDTGAIIAKKETAISEGETASELHDKLMHLGAGLVVETLIAIGNNEVFPIQQSVTGNLKDAPKLTPENTQIDWKRSGKEIVSFILGLSSYPGAWSMLNIGDEALRVKIFYASYIEEVHDLPVGRVVTDKTTMKVAVQNGFVSIEELQLPGKRRVDIRSLLNGFHVPENANFTE